MRIGHVRLIAALGAALMASPVAGASGGASSEKASVRKALLRKAPPRTRLRPGRIARQRLRPPFRRFRIAGRLPSHAEANRFMKRVIERERRFFQPGVSYDGETGLTFDGHPIEQRTGLLRGAPRNWSAASKESLHIIMLVKALTGDATARALLTPDPTDPDAAVGRALDVLGRKIGSYRRFHERNPGFAGFLPWFKVEGGELVPMEGWTDRVPGLDNGQLAWSLYLAEGALREQGHTELADAYREHLELMADNVVRVFYDPAGGHFRGEAKIGRGGGVAPGRNRYGNNGYLIKDAYEGLLLVHFADLMGRWPRRASGREKVWRDARRVPASYRAGTRDVTVVRGHWFSSHEDWGFLVLPFRDLPVADRLFLNGQRVRTQHSAGRGWSGLFASTHRPITGDSDQLAYENSAGIQEVALDTVRGGDPIFAPYAAFPLAMVDRRLFAGWMKSMVERPGMLGPYGVGESYSEDGRSAPLLTWDGKALPMIAWMGGVSAEIGRQLKRDGLHDGFMARVRHDYRKFDGQAISGEEVPFHAPPPAASRDR